MANFTGTLNPDPPAQDLASGHAAVVTPVDHTGTVTELGAGAPPPEPPPTTGQLWPR